MLPPQAKFIICEYAIGEGTKLDIMKLSDVARGWCDAVHLAGEAFVARHEKVKVPLVRYVCSISVDLLYVLTSCVFRPVRGIWKLVKHLCSSGQSALLRHLFGGVTANPEVNLWDVLVRSRQRRYFAVRPYMSAAKCDKPRYDDTADILTTVACKNGHVEVIQALCDYGLLSYSKGLVECVFSRKLECYKAIVDCYESEPLEAIDDICKYRVIPTHLLCLKSYDIANRSGGAFEICKFVVERFWKVMDLDILSLCTHTKSCTTTCPTDCECMPQSSSVRKTVPCHYGDHQKYLRWFLATVYPDVSSLESLHKRLGRAQTFEHTDCFDIILERIDDIEEAEVVEVERESDLTRENSSNSGPSKPDVEIHKTSVNANAPVSAHNSTLYQQSLVKFFKCKACTCSDIDPAGVYCTKGEMHGGQHNNNVRDVLLRSEANLESLITLLQHANFYKHESCQQDLINKICVDNSTEPKMMALSKRLRGKN
jgi:hypothetical protein